METLAPGLSTQKLYPIKVLHIQKVAGIAGSENHLLTLLPGLAKYGYDPTMLVLADRQDRPDPFAERMRAAGVPTKIMPIRGDLAPFLVPRLVRLIRQEKYDLVHTHLLHADLYGRVAARIGRARLVSTYHCDDPCHLMQGIRHLDRTTGKLCAAIICISKSVQAFVRSEIGLPHTLLHVVRYGLDPAPMMPPCNSWREKLGLRRGDRLLGIVARLTEQKGHACLLHAMRSVLEAYPATHLAIVGDGELRHSLEALTATLGLQKQVHFLGLQPDASQFISEFDIFVHPSLFEGFGLVFLEAMAAARPIVATRVSAIPEIVLDGETGLLVPPGEPEALAKALCRLIDNPELAEEFGRYGRQRLEERFTVDKMIEATLRVYQQVLQKPQERPRRLRVGHLEGERT